MDRRLWRLSLAIALSGFVSQGRTQTALSWQQVREMFEATNPTLKSAQLNIDESRAAEITAYLRPNPDFSLTMDGFQPAPNGVVWRPLSGVYQSPAFSYLHERAHERVAP
jgi:outer membrane protein, heavy metal efflux system